MPIEARMADGTMLRFPDGTADDVVDRAAQEYVRGGDAAAPQRTPGEAVARDQGLNYRTLLRGLAASISAAADAARVLSGGHFIDNAVSAASQRDRGLGDLVTGGGTQPEHYTPPSLAETANRVIDAITPTPETPSERIRERVGQEVTGVLVPGGIGRRMAQSAVPAARAFGEAVGSRLGLQTIGAVGAGTGGALAREQVPNSDAADALGTVTGLVTGVGVPALLARGARAVGAALAPLTQRGREGILTEGLLNASSDPATLEARLATGQREIVPGSQRTTAEVAGAPDMNRGASDPGLMGAERAARNADSPPFATRDAQRNTARDQAMTMAPPVAQSEAGDAARAGLGAERDRAARETSALYAAIPDDAGNFSARALNGQVIPRLVQVYGPSTQGLPTELVPIVQRLTNTADRLNYGDLRAMASEMGEVAGRASANQQNTLAAEAGRIKTAIENFMGSPGGLTPQQMRAHNTAIAARTAQGAAYDEGAVGSALGTNRYDRAPGAGPNSGGTITAEAVPGRLLAGPTAVQQTEAAAGGNQQVRDALRGAFAQRMRETIRTTTPDAQGNPTLSARAFHDFVNDAGNRGAIRYLYGDQGLRNVDRIAADFTSRQMVDNVGRAVGSNTVQNMSAARLMSAALGGLVNPRSVENHPLYRWTLGKIYQWGGVERAMQDMWSRVLTDPDYAQLLASRATPAVMRRATSMLNQPSIGSRLGNAAAGAVQPYVLPGVAATGEGERPPAR